VIVEGARADLMQGAPVTYRARKRQREPPGTGAGESAEPRGDARAEASGELR